MKFNFLDTFNDKIHKWLYSHREKFVESLGVTVDNAHTMEAVVYKFSPQVTIYRQGSTVLGTEKLIFLNENNSCTLRLEFDKFTSISEENTKPSIEVKQDSYETN